MSFTVEPGLYIPIDDESAPKEFRGIGIRIEDNVVVTAGGCENLTASCPKEISDLEAIIGSRG
jgi:Xaa-Pro aminopeptidase